MNGRQRDAQSLLAVLGHPSRFRIAMCLIEGERCVGELADAIGLSQSCTTRHVQALERAGVVHSRRDGKRVLVGIESGSGAVAGLLEWIAPEAADPGRRKARARTAGPRSVPARAGRAPSSASGVQAGRPARRAPKRPPGQAPSGPTGRPAPADPENPMPANSREDGAASRSTEAPPAGAPTSGTHATPEQTPSPVPRRPRETLEDYLL